MVRRLLRLFDGDNSYLVHLLTSYSLPSPHHLLSSIIIQHGRLKVKDKAEIEAEKKKKYQEKAARFKAGLDLCLKSVIDFVEISNHH